jgi:hypothetical protein
LVDAVAGLGGAFVDGVVGVVAVEPEAPDAGAVQIAIEVDAASLADGCADRLRRARGEVGDAVEPRGAVRQVGVAPRKADLAAHGELEAVVADEAVCFRFAGGTGAALTGQGAGVRDRHPGVDRGPGIDSGARVDLTRPAVASADARGCSRGGAADQPSEE